MRPAVSVESAESADEMSCLTVPQLCTGVSGLAWTLARAAYRLGAQGGPATWLYNRLRSPDAGPSRPQLSLLGSTLRRDFAGYDGIVLVDHPLLAHILADTCRVAYVHGEIAAPCSSAVPGAWRTFVPLESTSARLEAYGVKRAALTVTGLLIEPRFLTWAQSSFSARLARLSSIGVRSSESGIPLTVAFFTSGAYPRPHMHRIMTAAVSAAQAGHRCLIFWGAGWLRAARAQLFLRRFSLTEEQVRPLWSRDRLAETARAAELLPRLDVMVAAAHERTNWAVGLGLPMFALFPHIGPFARENYAFASQQGVCLPLTSMEDAHRFGKTLSELHRSGRLAEMARSGWGRYPITGAAAVARELLTAVGPTRKLNATASQP